MTLALVLGVLFGLSLILSWRLLFPPPPPLSAAVNRLQRRNALAGISSPEQIPDDSDSALDRIAGSLGHVLISLGMRLDHLEPDLRLLDRTVPQHMAKKVVAAFFGVALPQVAMLASSIVGVPWPLSLTAFTSLVLGVGLFFVPDLLVHSEAEERRQAFRHSLGSFLDLVVISLAGGSGVESALRDASAIGQGWAFMRLQRALEGAALTGQTPWVALTNLGEELGVPQLAELSASVSLAGTEGARVRDSLATKAASMRDHALSEVEAEAQSSTEKMAVPMVLMLMGFMALIGYPAFTMIAGG